MTGVLMLGGLALFLVNKRWSRISLICLVPVCGIVAYFCGESALTMAVTLLGMVAIAAAPLAERLVGWAGSRLAIIDAGDSDTSEDDILDNKKKWRLIVAGYVVFILFAIFSIAAIVRLNAKINTLYGFTQDLEERIEDVSDTK